jgi:hypothetical protein
MAPAETWSIRAAQRPSHLTGGVLVGAHDVKECTSKRGLVSCELKSPSARIGAIDSDNDPQLRRVVRDGCAAHGSGHISIVRAQNSTELGT